MNYDTIITDTLQRYAAAQPKPSLRTLAESSKVSHEWVRLFLAKRIKTPSLEKVVALHNALGAANDK